MTSQQVSGYVFSATLYDRPVTCSPYGYSCYDTEGGVEGDEVLSSAERQPSLIFGEAGLTLSFEIRRRMGGVGHLDLELPLNQPSSQTNDILLAYVETGEDGVVFEGRLVSAFLELAESSACPCTNIRVEALFWDVGPDGVEGSADDQERRINGGVIAEGGVSCRGNITLPLAEGLRVVEIPCPATPGGGTGGGTIDPPPSTGGGSTGGGWTSDDSAEVAEACAAGCNSTEGCASSDEGCGEDEGCDDSGGSCEGDQGCEGDSSGGGCEGDTSGGCEGGGSGSSCSGESCRVVRRTRRLPNATLVAVLFLLGLTQIWRHRRVGRRRRRRSKKGGEEKTL